MKKRKPVFEYKRVLAVLLLLALSTVVFVFINDMREREISKPIEDKSRSGKKVRESISVSEKTPTKKTRRVAIVIDDIGYDLSQVDELLKIRAPLTFAVLPHCQHSQEAAERIHRAGKEVLLHLPMEPLSPEKNPGKGVLLSGMRRDDIRRVLEEDLADVPYAVGANNHMGSRFMEDESGLRVLFGILEEKGIFFVDSLTTGRSRGRAAAVDTGIPFIARDIFIDGGDKHDTSSEDFLKAVKMNGSREGVVVIGHPYPSTIDTVRVSIEKLREEGLEVVPVSKLVKRQP
ncbi:MAG TPA: divergent polysaccharide deacetylase family protein [Syntrophales bacterium]|nr:divergent polysaccharide deacetylase family protein [Syntrophales bacterium]HRT70044.1 divergent polysaccharide deacetylase family protein [Syntrophales bacterium]